MRALLSAQHLAAPPVVDRDGQAPAMRHVRAARHYHATPHGRRYRMDAPAPLDAIAECPHVACVLPDGSHARNARESTALRDAAAPACTPHTSAVGCLPPSRRSSPLVSRSPDTAPPFFRFRPHIPMQRPEATAGRPFNMDRIKNTPIVTRPNPEYKQLIQLL